MKQGKILSVIDNIKLYFIGSIIYYFLVLFVFGLLTWNEYILSLIISILIVPFLSYCILIGVFVMIKDINKSESKWRDFVLRMYGLSVDLFASLSSVITLVMINTFITTDKFNIGQSIGSFLHLISNDVLEAKTNSLLISIVFFYIISFYLYKKLISSYYFLIGMIFKSDSVQILKESLGYKKLLADYTLIVFIVGVLPQLIKWIGVEDDVSRKIEEHSFVIASAIIVPYINLLYRDDLN